MNFVDNIDFKFSLSWREFDLLPEISDFVNATVTGGIYFDDIEVPAVSYGTTRFALITGLAVFRGIAV
jgi:hypothetical protein